MWQEAEEARRNKEEAARRLRNRTASFHGAETKDAFLDAARVLRVNASADERQIRSSADQKTQTCRLFAQRCDLMSSRHRAYTVGGRQVLYSAEQHIDHIAYDAHAQNHVLR